MPTTWSGRLRRLVVASAVLLCVSGLTAAVALRLSSGGPLWVVSKHVPRSARDLPVPSDERIRTLREQLLRATSDMGDHPAEGLLVITRRRRFYRAINESGPPESNDVIYILAARGNFTCNLCTRPAGGTSPQGTFMLSFHSANGHGTSGFQLGGDPPTDLSKLGRTIRLDLGS